MTVTVFGNLYCEQVGKVLTVLVPVGRSFRDNYITD